MNGRLRFFLCALACSATLQQAAAAPLQSYAQAENANLMAIISVATEPLDIFMPKWKTARGETPQIPTSAVFQPDQAIWFYGFYAGASRAKNGSVLLDCKITLIIPDEADQDIDLLPCVEAKATGPETDIYMTKGFSFALPAKYSGKKVRIDAVLSDSLTKAVVPLAVEFSIAPKSGALNE